MPKNEANPALGMRGIRFLLKRKRIFKSQVKAILRASRHKNVKIMLPMIANFEELAKSKMLIDECKAELVAAGVSIDKNIKVGIMMSRFTTITGKAKRGDFFTELVGDQLHIYVSNADTFGDSLFQLLPHLWTAHWEAISKNIRQEDEELERALRGLDRLIERISKRKTEWVS